MSGESYITAKLQKYHIKLVRAVMRGGWDIETSACYAGRSRVNLFEPQLGTYLNGNLIDSVYIFF